MQNNVILSQINGDRERGCAHSCHIGFIIIKFCFIPVGLVVMRNEKLIFSQ